MQRVLLVEDSREFQAIVKRTLEDVGCEVICASEVREADAILSQNSVDLILLDVMLPDGDGFQYCESLQKRDEFSDIPIIFLTGKGDVEDKVEAFELGADDYLVKPFEPKELKARVRSKLDRLRKRPNSSGSLKRGELSLKLALQKAYRSQDGVERDLELTPIEFKILYHLASHEGRTFSRDELLTSIWGDSIHVLEHNIYTHIYSVRRKLGPIASYLKSVPRSGYRFEVCQPDVS